MNLQLTDGIIHGMLHPRHATDLPFPELYRKLSSLPATLPELRDTLRTALGKYINFQFEEKIPDITLLVSDIYTPVLTCYISPEINMEHIACEDTPQTRFYDAVMRAEVKLTKLTLLEHARNFRSDIETRNEVREVLSYLCEYIRYINRHVECASDIFCMLTRYLVKLYYEVAILFEEILKATDYRPFDDFFYDAFSCYPSKKQVEAYHCAIYIGKVQRAIMSGKPVADLQPLLQKVTGLLDTCPEHTSLLAVATILENAIFLQQSSKVQNEEVLLEQEVPLQQLGDKTETIRISRECQQTINDDILSRTNPREIIGILEKEQESLTWILPCKALLFTIPRQLNRWLEEQIELCRMNIAQSFLPVEPVARQSSLKAKRTKAEISKCIRQAHKRLDFLSGCNPQNRKIISDTDYNRLLLYTDSFLQTGGELPADIHSINTGTSIEHLRYTYYLLYKEDCSRSIPRECFINFLHAVFSQFANTEKSTTAKVFSKAPKSYTQDVKSCQNKK